ncbi:hypothetical protein GCM10009804_70880 [Kribbella hippodromi]|uniref:CN hydrolase domain-containing protein n=1 Tax=Kribbella hippodromi TaxID=434347 RepID=A0ABP4QEB7_9ACTN
MELRKLRVVAIGRTPPGEVTAWSPEQLVEREVRSWSRLLEQVQPDRPELLLVPELCDRPGIGLLAPADEFEYYRVRGDRVRTVFADFSTTYECIVGYAAQRRSPTGQWFNALELIEPTGTGGTYNKNHLVIEEAEKGLSYGQDASVLDRPIGRLAPVICFDLNFQELQDRYAAQHPDIILFSSAFHGGLQQADWAFRCRSYFLSAVYGPNPSELHDPLGGLIASSTNYTPWLSADINLDRVLVHLDGNADRLAAAHRAYGRRIRIHDPGRLGVVMLTSEDADLTAPSVAAEFGMELLDEYLDRSRRHRADALGRAALLS